MADGMSGLSLSEMGISTVKKSAKVVQQVTNPFVQGVKQQVTGSNQTGGQVSPNESAAAAQKPVQQGSLPPSEGTVFDIFSQAKQQVAGSKQTTTASAGQQIFGTQKPTQKPQGGTLFTPQQAPAKAPDATGAPMSGNFDLNSMFGEKNPFGAKTQPQIMQQQAGPQISETEKAQKQAEEKQKLESLRKQLFDAYKQEFIEKAEGKIGKKEETLQERKQKEDQEEQEKQAKQQQEEEKMQFIAPPTSSSKMPGLGMKKAKSALMNLIKPKQGSKEGRSSKG
ncbi:MAG TPA: hypothetical protein VF820_05445 [Patescibacteria group bacterium]